MKAAPIQPACITPPWLGGDCPGHPVVPTPDPIPTPLPGPIMDAKRGASCQ